MREVSITEKAKERRKIEKKEENQAGKMNEERKRERKDRNKEG